MGLDEFIADYLSKDELCSSKNHEEPLFEMAKLCDKELDGYGFYVYVFGSDDPAHGRSEHLPIHAHVLTQLRPKIEIGKIDLSNKNPPKSANEVIDADKSIILDSDSKRKIVLWANKQHKVMTDKTNWESARTAFVLMNPHLFN